MMFLLNPALGLLAGIEEEESLEANIALEIAEENSSVLDELFTDQSKMNVIILF